jgi:hypothetical protein
MAADYKWERNQAELGELSEDADPDFRWVAVHPERAEHELETRLDARAGLHLGYAVDGTQVVIGLPQPTRGDSGRHVLAVAVKDGRLVLLVREARTERTAAAEVGDTAAATG